MWVCDGCGVASMWGAKWRWFPCVESQKNKDRGGKILPLSVCSDICEPIALANASV